MISFHGNQEIKDQYLARVRAHAAADEIIKGFYWENGKGCAIGCTIHSSNHKDYETELGIPEWLAWVEDKIFEGLAKALAKQWPERFLFSIPVGVDLDLIKVPFLIFVLESTLDNFDRERFPGVKQAIDDVIALYKTNETDIEKFKTAARRARAVSNEAYEVYATAQEANAACAAPDMLWAAAYAGVYATANSAALVSCAAANAAEHVANVSYAVANAAACAAAIEKFADKLIELICATEETINK
jgi:hypothetical protein